MKYTTTIVIEHDDDPEHLPIFPLTMGRKVMVVTSESLLAEAVKNITVVNTATPKPKAEYKLRGRPREDYESGIEKRRKRIIDLGLVISPGTSPGQTFTIDIEQSLAKLGRTEEEITTGKWKMFSPEAIIRKAIIARKRHARGEPSWGAYHNVTRMK